MQFRYWSGYTAILFLLLLLTSLTGCINKEVTDNTASSQDQNTAVNTTNDVELRQKRLQNEAREKVRHEQKMRNMRTSAAHSKQASLPAPPYATMKSEIYASLTENGLHLASEKRFSTFSVDVDTGSYTNGRRQIRQNRLPAPGSVRVEEWVNYFKYDYPEPNSGEVFSISTDLIESPWNKQTHVLKIGLSTAEVDLQDLPPVNLVFLVDVSGSMDAPDKLGLLKTGLKHLTKQLRPQDKVAIVTYSNELTVVLNSTSGEKSQQIVSAIDRLQAGGSTNGEAGIQLAYTLAQEQFVDTSINRIIWGTDGDLNVGITNQSELEALITQKRQAGIELTTVGFGHGNYREPVLERLADSGNGHYRYIDSALEAQKVFTENLAANLQVIAKDTKVQVEFNPETVKEYRLIGYENRMLKQEDFNIDSVDAGEVGAGHQVTALYEVVLTHTDFQYLDVGRYQKTPVTRSNNAHEIAWVRVKYKDPVTQETHEQQHIESLAKASPNNSNDTRFASLVATFGQYMQHSKFVEHMDLVTLSKLLQTNLKPSKGLERSDFARLMLEYTAIKESQ